LDDLDLVLAALRLRDDHVRAQADLAAADARAVRPRRETLRGVRVEVVLYVVPRGLDLFAGDVKRLRYIAELVLAKLAKVVGYDVLRMRRHLLAGLFEMLHLDEHAFAHVACADAPWLDGLDRPQRAHRVLDRYLHRLRRLLDRHARVEVPVLGDVANEVLGDGQQTRG